MKAILCVPTIKKPHKQTLDAIRASIPLLEDAGWEHGMVSEVGNPYISCARATMLRKAMDVSPDVVVFIDHDVSWKPADLLTLISHPGDVVSGLYRFKKPEVEYMGAVLSGPDGTPMTRPDGSLYGHSVPAGFLKVTKNAVGHFMRSYPGLVYGDPWRPCVDLFNHGAHEGVWYGEDYAFSRHWRECGGQIVVIPDLDITHHSGDESFPGNYHDFLRRQPGGDLHSGG